MKIRGPSILAAVLLVLLATSAAWALNEECSSCHSERVANIAASSHATLACEACHEGAANHGGNMTAKTTVHFDMEVCSGCHAKQYTSYKYGDSVKTKYGGSPTGWAKTNDFANYNDIIDGYGFTKEYSEERSHNVMLKDHFDVSRMKFETCLQCKSTKLAYYWDSGKTRTIDNDVYVKAGHMTTGLTVPRGTTVTMSTDRKAPFPNTHEVKVVVTLPSGTKYSSYDLAGATKDPYWTWSALYAFTVNDLAENSATHPSGNGCNHCHNPHKVGRTSSGGLLGFRLIRKSLIDAIDRRGLNPTVAGSPKVFDENAPLNMDGAIALCGQCHVEYVCGKSSIDGIDRDYFPWAKVSELETIYKTNFPGYGPYANRKYVQDWVHGTGALSSLNSPANGVYYKTPYPILEDLVKSQHPEAETYWGSRHYGNNAPCFICHMPKVTATDGKTFTSHWLASPLKYMTPSAVGAFATAVGGTVDKDGIIAPCGACHGGTLPRMKTKAENIQDNVYASALQVQTALVASLKAIKAAKDAQTAGTPVDATLLKDAVDAHRAGHVRWENLIISENSMGFHNNAEVSAELKNALTSATTAQSKATSAIGAAPPPAGAENTRKLCSDSKDNDGDGLIDCADPDCKSYCP